MDQDNSQPVSRRAFLRGAAGAAAGAAAAAAVPSARAATAASTRKRRLNVLFLMSDDMRVELASYGSRFNVHSPSIDRLGSQGIRFDRDYCQFPLCNPSRSSLLTGRVPLETRVLDNRTGVRDLHPDWTTLPQLFRENGYTTLRSGKIFHGGLDDHKAWTDFAGETESLHFTAKATPMDIPRERIPRPDGTVPPFPHDERALHSDEILVLQGNGEGAGDYVVADLAMQYLRKCRNEPFFIACGVSKPHSPPTAPQRFFDLYDPAAIQLPPDFAAWPTVPPGFPAAAIRPRNADLFIGRGASESEAKQVIRAYLASISWADWNLGRVLSELDQLGLRDKTIVVFVADHGYQLGEKGKWSKAGSLFEPGTRVPLIIHAPDAQGNGCPCLRVVQSLDIYRTLAGLCGLDVPGGTEGADLAPLLHDPQSAWDQPAYSIWSEDGKTVHGTAIRTEQWRYAEFGQNAANGAMLFDVHADPLELQNLANNPAHADVVRALSKQVNAYSYSA